ncbi:MAG: sensor histidine kinase, partial [Chloroflexota bacterium]
MQTAVRSLGLVERTTTLFRLLTVMPVVCAATFGGQPLAADLAILYAGYLVVTGLLLLLTARLGNRWLAYVSALIDAGFVTGVLGLWPASPVPLWALYLFPLASAAAAGQWPVVVATGASVAGYIAVAWLSGILTSPLALWPVVFLAAAAVPLVALSSHWLIEREEKQAWQAIADAAQALRAAAEPPAVAEAIVGRACRLTACRGVCLWWWGQGSTLTPGPQAGLFGEAASRPLVLEHDLARRLERGPVPLTEFGEPFVGLAGEAVALIREQGPLALLAVTWDSAREDNATRRGRLAALAGAAAGSLGEALDRAAAREQLRWEGVLRQMATDLAATLETGVAYQIIGKAVHVGLKAAVALVAMPSGSTLYGDREVGGEPLQRAIEARTGRQKPDAEQAQAVEPGGTVISMITDDLALAMWRESPRPGEADAARLAQLAVVARGALKRCATYDQLRGEARRLWACLEAAPAPLALWDGEGTRLLANLAYRALNLPASTPSAGLLGETHEVEVVVGEPPRTFVAQTVPVGEAGNALSLFREVTREREALRAKDELIAVVGHELRLPLTSIYGYSQMMARQLGIVQRQVGELNRLIGDFVEA